MGPQNLEDAVDEFASSFGASLSFQGTKDCRANVTAQDLGLISLVDPASRRHQDIKPVEGLPQALRDEAFIESLEHAVTALRHGESLPLARAPLVI